jgi:hypothetical protein
MSEAPSSGLDRNNLHLSPDLLAYLNSLQAVTATVLSPRYYKCYSLQCLINVPCIHEWYSVHVTLQDIPVQYTVM